MPLLGTRGAASAQGFGEFAQQASVVQAEAIDYDGTNDWLTNSSGLTGNTAGKTFTFSAFVYLPTTGSNKYIMMFGSYANNAGFHVFLNGSNRLFIRGYSGSSAVLDMNVGSPEVPLSTFMSIVVSIDLANAANRHVYLNDIDVTSSVTWTTYSNANIDFNTTPQWIAHTGSPYPPYKGRLSNVFLDKTYRNLSVTANRRLFVKADLSPAVGQAALNPLVYVPMSDPTQPGLNQGTGGNFTLTGVVARSGRGPNQYNAVYANLNSPLDNTQYVTEPSYSATTYTAVTIAFSTQLTGTWRAYMSSGADPFLNVGTGGISVQISQWSPSYVNKGTVSIPLSFVAGRNYNVVISINAVSGAYSWCVNGQSGSGTVSLAAGTAQRTQLRIRPPSNQANSISNFYVAYDSYLDMTSAANIAKFMSGTGIDAAPVYLGASGELPTGSTPRIYLPFYANNPGTNKGSGGNWTENGAPYVGARGPNEYWGNKAVFNGTTGNLRRTSALTGIVNGKTWSFSFFVARGKASVPDTELVLSMGRTGFNPGQILLNSSGYIQFLLHNSSNTTILLGTTSTTQMVNNTTYHVCGCIDLTNTAKRFIFVNGVQQTVSWSYYTNDTIAWTSYDLPTLGSNIGSGGSYVAYLQGFLSEFYMTTSYIDFSQEANRLLFIDAFGYPTNLPAAITGLTVPEPTIYMRFPPTSFGTNSGAGGNFTVNGTITDGGQL